MGAALGRVFLQPMYDSLYVERVLHFLQRDAFGPYHSGTLLKYPGTSYWLADMRALGIPFLLLVAAVFAGPHSVVHAAEIAGEAIRLDVPVLPGLQRHVDLLARPGYVAIVLENNGLAATQSSKVMVGDKGRSAEIRSATVRFVDKKGAVYAYEAGYLLGLGESQISFPITVDVSAVPAGRVTVTVSPPLARLIPTGIIDRIRFKTGIIASINTQQKILDYLDSKSQQGDLVEAVLLDAYNRGQGPTTAASRDAEPVSFSDTWLLLLTLLIWLVIVPGYLFVARRRREERPGT
jgi:hypothetical protein